MSVFLILPSRRRAMCEAASILEVILGIILDITLDAILDTFPQKPS